MKVTLIIVAVASATLGVAKSANNDRKYIVLKRMVVGTAPFSEAVREGNTLYVRGTWELIRRRASRAQNPRKRRA